MKNFKLWKIAGTILLTTLLPGALTADVVKKTKKVDVTRGQSADLQTMYYVAAGCVKWDNPPPQPQISSQPKLGELKISLGKANPHQCPNKEVGAYFAEYIAGDQPGTDKFHINWKRSNGQRSFSIRYIINVK